MSAPKGSGITFIFLVLCLATSNAFIRAPYVSTRCASSSALNFRTRSHVNGWTKRRKSDARLTSAAMLKDGKLDPQGNPYPEGKYDPITAQEYFKRRPWEAASRATEIITNAGVLFLAVWFDELFGRAAVLEEQRARETVKVIINLGPTFVKIGQSLSVRGDLLPAAYIKELTKLTSQVPFFDSTHALKIILQDLQLDSIYDMFSAFSSQPVAAASLGQVYRATLRQGGQEVAVKVQRPDVHTLVACDLFLLRIAAAPLLSRLGIFAGVSSMVALVDELGARFVNELDYTLEAGHAEDFNRAMLARGLQTQVFAPAPVRAACSPRVLTCSWVQGVPLDIACRTFPEDSGALSALCLNSYLTMMLDSSVLHCDPHPGNLLRADDGRLCILDWGLVVRVDADLQYALIEYLAHLTTADYSAIPRDLEALGFVPRGREADVRESGLIDVLSGVLAELSAVSRRGGLSALEINEVVAKLVGITKTYGALFQIPPYFAYIIRAYTVLEGIGRQADPSYSTVAACYPYLARRLLTDPSPRIQAALKDMLYGGSASEKNGKNKNKNNARRLDLQRLASLADSAQELPLAPLSDAAANDVMEILLSSDGNFVQDILLDEAALLIEALTRQAVADLANTPGGRLASSTLLLQKQLADLLGPAAVFALPLTLPAQIAAQVQPLVALTAQDLEVLTSVRELAATAQFAQFAQSSRAAIRRPTSVKEAQEVLRQGLQAARAQGPNARMLVNRLLALLQRRGKDRVRIAAESALASSLKQQLSSKNSGKTEQ